jgi:hypothetical protein
MHLRQRIGLALSALMANRRTKFACALPCTLKKWRNLVSLSGKAYSGDCCLDHDDFGWNSSKLMKLIYSRSLELDAGGKPVSAFPHPGLATFDLETSRRGGPALGRSK